MKWSLELLLFLAVVTSIAMNTIFFPSFSFPDEGGYETKPTPLLRRLYENNGETRHEIIDLEIVRNETNKKITTLDDATPTPTNENNVTIPRHSSLSDNNEKGEGELPPTGSFANCTNHTIKLGTYFHPDQKNVTISCHTLPYRFPINSNIDIKKNSRTIGEILIGVLSAASGEGPARRMSIRNTWAKNHRNSVFFIVAGPWEGIQSEYDQYQDLIWLDQEENYFSGLTYKTLAFMKIAHDYFASSSSSSSSGQQHHHGNMKYAFKTDDDSFVNVDYLREYLLGTKRDEKYDYWGKCSSAMFKPRRDPSYKWGISYEYYPEEYFPPYCQGGGFALSRKFLDCVAGSPSSSSSNSDTNDHSRRHQDDNHLANIRFIPFEDAATGLLAERCGITPSNIDNMKLIHHFRTPLKMENDRVRFSQPKIEKKYLTMPDMKGRVVQHRIYDEWDMMEHYKQVQNPDFYRKTTEFQWYKPKYEEIYRWKEDTVLNPDAVNVGMNKK